MSSWMAIRCASIGIEFYTNLRSSLYVDPFLMQINTNEGQYISFKLGLQYLEECLL
jgi:hypothetical protein